MLIYTPLVLAAALFALVVCAPLSKHASNKKTVLLLALTLFSTPLALYFVTHDASQFQGIVAEQARRQNASEQAVALMQKIKETPGDVMLWVQVAKHYSTAGNFAMAAEAYKQAITLTQGNPAYILAYAESLVYAAGGIVTEKARESFNMVLMMDKGNPLATYFIALDEFEAGNKTTAKASWQTLKDSLPANSPLIPLVDAGLAQPD